MGSASSEYRAAADAAELIGHNRMNQRTLIPMSRCARDAHLPPSSRICRSASACLTLGFMEPIAVRDTSYMIGRALREDVAEIVALLRDDSLGASREQDDLTPYEAAFDAIDRDPNHLLVVVKDQAGAVIGTMQLTLLPGLARRAATRLHIEAVRVDSSARATGLGTAVFEWAHNYGRQHGAVLAQLATDKQREDAYRFYRRLGYEATHEGMKRPLVDG